MSDLGITKRLGRLSVSLPLSLRLTLSLSLSLLPQGIGGLSDPLAFKGPPLFGSVFEKQRWFRSPSLV